MPDQQEPTLPLAINDSTPTPANVESPVNTLNHVTRPAPAVDDSPPASSELPALPSTSQSGAVADLCDTTAEMEKAQVSNRFKAILPVPVQKRPQSTRTVKSPTHILTNKEHSDFLEEKPSKKKENQGKTKDQSKL